MNHQETNLLTKIITHSATIKDFEEYTSHYKQIYGFFTKDTPVNILYSFGLSIKYTSAQTSFTIFGGKDINSPIWYGINTDKATDWHGYTVIFNGTPPAVSVPFK